MTAPLLVYDDDCGFCTRSAFYAAEHGDVEAIPFSDVDDDLREVLPADWRDCAHLVVDGTVYSCGEAMERAYERTGKPMARMVPYLRQVPGYGRAREVGYRWIAENRPLVSRLTRRFFD